MCPMSMRSLLIHTAWQATKVAEMYSASIVDRAIISYFFKLYAIAPELKLNTQLDVLRLSSVDLPQSLT